MQRLPFEQNSISMFLSFILICSLLACGEDSPRPEQSTKNTAVDLAGVEEFYLEHPDTFVFASIDDLPNNLAW
jgi:hypothetical protein